MAYFIKKRSGKLHLHSTKTNGSLGCFGKDVDKFDIQGNEIVVYKNNGKLELYRIIKGSVKGPFEVR